MKGEIAILSGVAIAVGMVQATAQSNAQSSLQVRVNRWLQLRNLSGQVAYVQQGSARKAQVGDLLKNIGDGVTTSQKSKAILSVDTGIGTIDVSENTKLWIQELSFAPDNGRITRLQVGQGQARLKVRPFTHKGSKLEILTPASLSGVRGTDFDVGVQPNGKTGLAVLSGAVQSAAQGKSQSVPGGFQNFTIPGEAPTPPVPITNNTNLEYQVERVIQGGNRKVRLIGKVDPVNTVLVNRVPQVTDRNGRFTTDLWNIPDSFVVQVIVTTPLGVEKSHLVTLRR